MKKEFLKATGITEEMFIKFCEEHNLNYKCKEVEREFIKGVFAKKIVLKGDKLVYGL